MVVRLRVLLITIILLLLVFPPLLQGSGENVHLISVEGAIEYSLERYLDRAFKEAHQQGASAIILEFNTPGGRIDASQDIRHIITESNIPVHAYVRPHALSAGAYLSMACDSLFMAPGGTIGAAEPRVGVGAEEAADEKILSAWESDMRTVAEMRDRDPDIAAAMVRKELSIPDIVETGNLLTLTSQEALSIGFIDGVFASRGELLEHLGLQDAHLIQEEMAYAERLARLITHPVVSTLLLTVGMAALILEIMTAGFGVAGSISVLSFTLFFGGHIIAGLAGYEVVILFLTGILLLIIEAFVTGFGLLGAGGAVAMVAAIVLSAASTGEGLRNLIIALILATVIIVISFKYLIKSTWLRNIILSYKEDKDLGYVGPKEASQLLDKEGITITTLRPSGTAEIEGNRIDVVSDGGYIPGDTRVKVVKIEGTRVVVREAKSKED